jgi:carboxyl-terminal processing protease
VKITIAKYYTPSGRCVQRLEYYDKENGAKPKEVPDSLLKTFQTRNGRKVIDGRGIEPDVDIELQDLSRLSAMLLTGNHIFNFATDYAFKHKTIAPAGEFKLTDAEYAEFKTYVLAREFKYNTASEEMLKKVKETAEKEGYFEDVKADYEVMLAKLTPSKDRDLDKFKEEVSEMLENEIVSRYYFQKGRTLDSFRYDKTLNKGKSILSNLSEYNTILKK